MHAAVNSFSPNWVCLWVWVEMDRDLSAYAEREICMSLKEKRNVVKENVCCGMGPEHSDAGVVSG